MIQDPNPTDYPHLEAFIDWMYDHVKELPADVETLKARIQRAASNPQGSISEYRDHLSKI